MIDLDFVHRPNGRDVFRRWRHDEAGSMEALSYILITAVVCIGVFVGLTTFRNSTAQALGGIADSMNSISQTYTVSMTFAQIGGGTVTKSFGYTDTNIPPARMNGVPPAGMNLQGPATKE